MTKNRDVLGFLEDEILPSFEGIIYIHIYDKPWNDKDPYSTTRMTNHGIRKGFPGGFFWIHHGGSVSPLDR